MPPKRDPVPRVRSAPQWLGGLFVLGLIGAAVVTGGRVLWENVDVQRMTASAALREPDAPPLPLLSEKEAHPGRTLRAALYYSRASAGYYSDADYYPGLLDRWEQLATAAGSEVTRIFTAEEIDSLDTSQVLIAPSALCLDTSEVAAMRRFADAGGGMVLTWATGARDSSCAWVGWEALSAITEVEDINTLERRQALYLTVPAGLPLSAGFGPATRIGMLFESQIALATEGPRVYWSDWALNAEPVEGITGMDAAAWMGQTYAGGRIAWFGFRIGHGATARDEEYISRLFRNGIWWAAGVPIGEISPWPHGNRSALLLVQDAESHFANVAALADVVREKAVPATFFVVSQSAIEHSSIGASLTTAGEVGSHTSDHVALAGRSYVDQRARLSRTQAEIEDWVGSPALGLSPPEERFDENTLRAWSWTGGRYIVAVNEARAASPEVFDTPDGSVVLLPRVIKNDYNVYVQDGAMRSMRLTRAYLAGMAKISSLGALAVVSLRSQVGGEGNRVQVVAEIIDSARTQGDWWFATGAEMAEWWLERWESTLEMRDSADGRLEVTVRASEQLGLTGAWLELFLPGDPEDWVPRYRGATVRHIRTEWGIRIPLESIAPGTEASIELARLN